MIYRRYSLTGELLQEKSLARSLNCTSRASVLNGAQRNVATIRDKSISPGEGFRFPITQTGYTATGSHYQQLLQRIREHCSANKIEQPTEEGIQQWLCDNLPLRCVEGGKLYANQYADRKNWPLFLRPMRAFARSNDKGLGDIVARQIPAGDAFKVWFKATFGFSCGCNERKNWLNLNFPL